MIPCARGPGGRAATPPDARATALTTRAVRASANRR